MLDSGRQRVLLLDVCQSLSRRCLQLFARGSTAVFTLEKNKGNGPCNIVIGDSHDGDAAPQEEFKRKHAVLWNGLKIHR